ncbi:MAG: hypothetical protein ACYS0H_20695 [Planctomycetota bacterium]|jgi:hypothetical protein
MISLLLIVLYILVGVGLTVLGFVILWRFMRAHESIAESMKIVAETESTKVLAEQIGKESQR